MTGKITHSSEFDYENVVKRLKTSGAARKTPQRGKAAQLRSARAAGPAVGAPPRPPLWSRLKNGIRNESKQMVAASLILAGFATWLGSSAQALYAKHEEAVLAGACRDKELAHAGSTYCFDERRIVHKLKEDGTTVKPGLDWRVNEAAHRKAEAAATREARGIPAP
jgi:hypothetical protein